VLSGMLDFHSLFDRHGSDLVHMRISHRATSLAHRGELPIGPGLVPLLLSSASARRPIRVHRSDGRDSTLAPA
jgi:hypothetical protein